VQVQQVRHHLQQQLLVEVALRSGGHLRQGRAL
jgi:hypothetical protein